MKESQGIGGGTVMLWMDLQLAHTCSQFESHCGSGVYLSAVLHGLTPFRGEKVADRNGTVVNSGVIKYHGVALQTFQSKLCTIVKVKVFANL
jgi:hypothetical protein